MKLKVPDVQREWLCINIQYISPSIACNPYKWANVERAEESIHKVNGEDIVFLMTRSEPPKGNRNQSSTILNSTQEAFLEG